MYIIIYIYNYIYIYMNITQSHTICPDRLRLRLQAAALRLLRAQLTQLGGDQALLLRLRTSGETSETYGEIQHGSALSRKGYLLLIWLWINTYRYSLLGDEHPFATYFDVHQGYMVLTHSHIYWPMKSEISKVIGVMIIE